MNQYNDLEESILMGFPETSDDILVLNYILNIIFLYNNELDLYVCQTQVKVALNIEHSICKKRNEHQKFIKTNSHIYEKL